MQDLWLGGRRERGERDFVEPYTKYKDDVINISISMIVLI